MTVTNPFISFHPSAAERMHLRFCLRQKADAPLAAPGHPYLLANPASLPYARFWPVVGQTSLYKQRPILSASADNQHEAESSTQPIPQLQAFLPKLGNARQPFNEVYPGREATGSEPAVNSPAAKPRLLVIDDNTDAAFTLSMLLRLKGYEVHSRYGGREGLAAAEQLRPAIILCDIGMPEMDGYETARLIKQQPWGKAITLVALTGYGQAEDRRRTKEAGFAHHLTKPVDLAVLIALLEALSCP